MGRDHTIFALIDGVVKFFKKGHKEKTFISVINEKEEVKAEKKPVAKAKKPAVKKEKTTATKEKATEKKTTAKKTTKR